MKNHVNNETKKSKVPYGLPIIYDMGEYIKQTDSSKGYKT